MVRYKQPFFEFWDQWWVLHSFTKYYWGDMTKDYVCTQFRDFTKMCLVHSIYSDNGLFLFHLRWKGTRLTDKKVSKYIVRGCSSFEVGIVLTYVEKVTTS